MIGLVLLGLFFVFSIFVLYSIYLIYKRLKASEFIKIIVALFIPLTPIIWFVSDELIVEKQLQAMCQKANFGKAVFDPNKISNIIVRQEKKIQLIEDTVLSVEYGELSNFNAKTGDFLYKYEYFRIVQPSRLSILMHMIYFEFNSPTFLISKQPCNTLDTPNLKQFNSKYE